MVDDDYPSPEVLAKASIRLGQIMKTMPDDVTARELAHAGMMMLGVGATNAADYRRLVERGSVAHLIEQNEAELIAAARSLGEWPWSTATILAGPWVDPTTSTPRGAA